MHRGPGNPVSDLVLDVLMMHFSAAPKPEGTRGVNALHRTSDWALLKSDMDGRRPWRRRQMPTENIRDQAAAVELIR